MNEGNLSTRLMHDMLLYWGAYVPYALIKRGTSLGIPCYLKKVILKVFLLFIAAR